MLLQKQSTAVCPLQSGDIGRGLSVFRAFVVEVLSQFVSICRVYSTFIFCSLARFNGSDNLFSQAEFGVSWLICHAQICDGGYLCSHLPHFEFWFHNSKGSLKPTGELQPALEFILHSLLVMSTFWRLA